MVSVVILNSAFPLNYCVQYNKLCHLCLTLSCGFSNLLKRVMEFEASEDEHTVLCGWGQFQLGKKTSLWKKRQLKVIQAREGLTLPCVQQYLVMDCSCTRPSLACTIQHTLLFFLINVMKDFPLQERQRSRIYQYLCLYGTMEPFITPGGPQGGLLPIAGWRHYSCHHILFP